MWQLGLGSLVGANYTKKFLVVKGSQGKHRRKKGRFVPTSL